MSGTHRPFRKLWFRIHKNRRYLSQTGSSQEIHRAAIIILKRAGYVKSRRGADGGYMLAKEPAQISLAEIVRLMDGALAPVNSVSKYFYECTPLEKNEALIKVFREIRDYIADKMENTTFADLIKE